MDSVGGGRIARRVLRKIIRMLYAIVPFHHNLLAGTVHFRKGALRFFQAVLSDPINLLGRFLAAVLLVVNDHVTTFL